MLVLSRDNRQQIQIGDDIVVTILEVRGSKVKVGIDAPKDMKVVRLPGFLNVEVRRDGEMRNQ